MTTPLEPLQAPPAEPRPVPWRALEGLAIFLVSWLVAAGISLVVTVGFVLATGDRPGENLLTAITLVVHAVVLTATVLAWVRIRYGMGPTSLGLRRPRARDLWVGVVTAVGGVAAAAVVFAVVAAIVSGLSGDAVDQPRQIPLEGRPSTATLALIGVSVLLLAPIAEETLFRGFVYRGFRRWAAPVPAGLLSAAVFAAVHVVPLVLAPIFVLGVLLARVAERQGSIVPSVIAHMLFNVAGFVSLVLNPG